MHKRRLRYQGAVERRFWSCTVYAPLVLVLNKMVLVLDAVS
jgi:hypothetical protein